MSETLKLLLILVCAVWALILCAFLVYLGWVYLELKRIGLSKAQQKDLRKAAE